MKSYFHIKSYLILFLGCDGGGYRRVGTADVVIGNVVATIVVVGAVVAVANAAIVVIVAAAVVEVAAAVVAGAVVEVVAVAVAVGCGFRELRYSSTEPAVVRVIN